MRRTLALMLDFAHCEKGANAIEYALVAVGIAVAVIGGLMALGQATSSLFNSVGNALP